jgi:hypothetical protein
LRAQKSVECRRSSASLKIAQEATQAFLAGSPGRLRCYDLSDAAEPMLAIGVMMVGLFAVLWVKGNGLGPTKLARSVREDCGKRRAFEK